MKKILIMMVAAIVAVSSTAENGSSLWLRYGNEDCGNNYGVNSDGKGAQDIRIKGAKASDPTIALAVSELRRSAIGTPVSLRKTRGNGAQDDAYAIKADAKGVSIESGSAVGLLYGAFDLARRKALGHDLTQLDVAEAPAYKLRVLNHWDNLDGTVERGYAGHSLWQWDSLPAHVSPRYAEYARACASVGINAAVLNNVNASPRMLSDSVLAKVKVLADIFRPYGIKVFLSVNFASPKALGEVATADPMDAQVQAWWRAKAAQIYRLVPDFGGFLVKANSEGEPGPGDYDRSHSQGANMLADAVAPYGGVIMWRAFVYNPSSPDRAKQAFEEFTPLDGEFRDNVIIQIKNGPVDFQPREPFSPLFGAMPQTQQMVEFQITQEYLGASNHLVYLAPLFKECLDSDTHRGEGTIAALTSTPHHGWSAIAGVANIGDSGNWCGHDFAQANWYAFGRLAWNPTLTSAEIADEWLGLTFNTDADFRAKAAEMMLGSREAAVDYMMPVGLHHIFAGNHHYGPEPWYYVDGIRLDWTPIYYHRADADGVGFDRTMATGSGATGEYAEPLATIYEHECPIEYLLWFHHVGWNDRVSTGRTLWAELCHRYSSGVAQVRDYQKVWDALKPYVDSERHGAVQSKLKIQAHDAQWWKDACLLYFQEINGLDFPADMERPVYDMEQLRKVQIPLGLFGCPTRDMLP